MHAAKKVSDKAAFRKFLSEISYSCGGLMKDVLEEEDIVRTVFVRADITCCSIIELPYYSAKYKDVLLSVVILPIWILANLPIQCAAYVRRKV